MHPIVSRCFRPNKWFGHSYTALREINRFTLSTGIIVGMLIGLIPISLPGGLDFKLGLAGGPLIAKLILGDAGRTVPLVWYFPYNANLLLPQLGPILLFAGVGDQSGPCVFQYADGGRNRSGHRRCRSAGHLRNCLSPRRIGYKGLKIPMTMLAEMLAGLHTQPAVLSDAVQQTKNDLPNLGYVTTFPMATIANILLAQLLLLL